MEALMDDGAVGRAAAIMTSKGVAPHPVFAPRLASMLGPQEPEQDLPLKPYKEEVQNQGQEEDGAEGIGSTRWRVCEQTLLTPSGVLTT